MTTFYTCNGDGGKSRVWSKDLLKDDILFQLLGGLDELNSWLGLCRSGAGRNRKLKEVALILKDIQQSLFVIQAEVAAIGSGNKPRVKISAGRTEVMEKIIDGINLKLPPIKKFIIPGGSELSAQIDIARAMARRIERMAITFSRKNKLRPELLKYLNRLSGMIFALARLVNYKLKIKEENPSYK